jgi:hypothetical protein
MTGNLCCCGCAWALRNIPQLQKIMPLATAVPPALRKSRRVVIGELLPVLFVMSLV